MKSGKEELIITLLERNTRASHNHKDATGCLKYHLQKTQQYLDAFHALWHTKFFWEIKFYSLILYIFVAPVEFRKTFNHIFNVSVVRSGVSALSRSKKSRHYKIESLIRPTIEDVWVKRLMSHHHLLTESRRVLLFSCEVKLVWRALLQTDSCTVCNIYSISFEACLKALQYYSWRLGARFQSCHKR